MKAESRWSRFPYGARAAEVEAARAAVRTAFDALTRRDDPDDPATAAWDAAIARFNATLTAAYPPGFWQRFGALKRGRASGIEPALAFLEADPWFFRSGYVKEDLIRFLKRLPLTPEQGARLRGVVLAAVEGRDRREFRCYCHLARRVDGPELRQELDRRLRWFRKDVRRRAAWMLDALGPEAKPRGKTRHPPFHPPPST